jgi:hypothetical protein
MCGRKPAAERTLQLHGRMYLQAALAVILKGAYTMLFPKEKMSHTPTFQGNKTEEGWLVLDIGNMELEGVTRLYVDLIDIKEVKARREKETDALSQAKKLLGG